MNKWLPFLKHWKKTHPEIPYESPVWLGNRSNGEFFHEQTPHERKVRAEVLRVCDEKARKLGMDRRAFMASTMGMATTAMVIQACGSDGASDDGMGGSSGAGGGGAGTGGSAGGSGYCVPEAATCDEDAARELLTLGNDSYFIMDMQSHCIEDEETWRERHPDHVANGDPYSGDGLANLLSFAPGCRGMAECIGDDRYVQTVILDSEVTLAVLSGFPGGICSEGYEPCLERPAPRMGGGHPLSNDFMAELTRLVNAEAASQRMVHHCQVAPNDNWELQAQMLDRIKNDFGNHGWKCYPPWTPRFDGGGWWLDDDMNRMDPQSDGPVADALFQKIMALTPSSPAMGCPDDYPQRPILCIHKGPSFGGFFTAEFNDTRDVPLAAQKYPEIDFVIYHSGGGGARGPEGLAQDIEAAGLTGKNVYAELGSTWASASTDPARAVQLIGRLMQAFGEDNVLWGSESMWLGSPQPQLELLKMLQIPADNPAGFPELTRERRAKILGLNAARLYGIDVNAARCKFQSDGVVRVKQRLDEELGPRRWALMPQPNGPRTRREFLRLNALRRAKGVPG